MKNFVLLILFASFCSVSFAADNQARESKAADRVQAAAEVLNEIQGAPDSRRICRDSPAKRSARGRGSIDVERRGFIVGAKYGRLGCTAQLPHRQGLECAGIFITEGGSVGFQIGGQAVDLVMLIMNNDGMQHLLSSKFELGADASVAAGPVGRHAEGNTDCKMRAQVCDTIPRARGIFASVSGQWRSREAGQGQYARVLRTHGDVQSDINRRG